MKFIKTYCSAALAATLAVSLSACLSFEENDGPDSGTGRSMSALSVDVHLGGLHWYTANCVDYDASVPFGQRGWNVESVYNSGTREGYSTAYSRAQSASNYGLVNIVRIDYQNGVAVPESSSAYSTWASNFYSIVNDFKNAGLATVFIVGNEPNVEGCITAAEYASAFNYLYSYSGRPAGVEILAAGPATYSPNPDGNSNANGCTWGAGNFLDWFGSTLSSINTVDGIAFHTYGSVDQGCSSNPAVACSRNGWPFDGGFQSYKDQIARIPGKFAGAPLYITETNTDGQKFDGNDPRQHYPTNWINNAFADIRNYNAANGGRIKALVWFVGANDSQWADFSLDNIAAACTDIKEEFRNTANYTGAPPTQGNGADISLSLSSVPTSMSPNETRSVTVHVTNTGGTTWTAGAAHRLGATAQNGVTWSNFACGGYSLGTTNQRAYVCGNVGPGQSEDFTFDITAPSSTGTVNLAAQMVQDGVEWFGNQASWPITVATAGCSTTALSRPSDRWRLKIWNNRYLSGSPVEIRYDAVGSGGFAFDWGSGSASSCAGNDNFSIRFVRDAYFSSAGVYRFTATVDDGVRLYVDDVLILDRWYDQAPTSHAVDATLSAGWHKIRMDYYENGGGAYSALSWSYQGVPYPGCPCDRADNYCQHNPSTTGCPMTFPGGYCDPNGDGGYGDADWTRGWTEYQTYCQ